MLQVANDANLGAPSAPLGFVGGTLRTTADMSTARVALVGSTGGTLETVAGTTLTYNGTMAGPGSIAKTGTGTLILTAANSQGGIAINGGQTTASSINVNLLKPNSIYQQYYRIADVRVAKERYRERFFAPSLARRQALVAAGGDRLTLTLDAAERLLEPGLAFQQATETAETLLRDHETLPDELKVVGASSS